MIEFSQIMTNEIIYYDSEYPKECMDFCRSRKIGFLPHIHYRNECYTADIMYRNFHRSEMKDRQFVEAGENIFGQELLGKFEEFKVLFARHHGDLVGVVHFSDYNRRPVYEHLYSCLLTLERGLVYLIIERGVEREKLFRIMNIETGRNSGMTTRADFRRYRINLGQILSFVQQEGILKVRKEDVSKIYRVRNKIAHSDNLISRKAPSDPALDYDFGTFKGLIEGEASLRIALKQLQNRLYFLKASGDEDFTLPTNRLGNFLFK